VKWSDDGYKVRTIPVQTSDNLLRRINEEFARDFDSDRIRNYLQGTFFPELAASAEMRAYGSELATVMGVDSDLVCNSAQIALRFPGDRTETQGWHVDGIPTEGNGVPAADWTSECGAILGIYLSDVIHPNEGALVVSPGSHQQVETFAKQYGWNVLRRGVLPPGSTTVGAETEILGRAGTAMLFHPWLVHRVLPNLGRHIRYAVYFRYYRKESR
jgi:ectoine hydroxylase-related dioxygenase (phytanoyl-CoA dioxygenase family)